MISANTMQLESSVRRVAFSVEWQKPADSVEVVGSAAHVLVRTSNKSSRHGSTRKPGRKPFIVELKVDSRDVGVYWRRGGRLSRQVFHWKRLPKSLTYKAVRQGYIFNLLSFQMCFTYHCIFVLSLCGLVCISGAN